MIDPKTELLRRRGEMSWRELGRLWGISHSYLWQVAQGNVPMSDSLLEKLGLRIVYERINGSVGAAGARRPDRGRASGR